MKTLIVKILFVLIVMTTQSCSNSVYSPGISFTNLSDNYIYNTEGLWNRYELSGPQLEMTPGGGGSEVFTLRKKSDLYGPVHIEWENAQRKKIVKDFVFTKDLLPNFSEKHRGEIYFYLTQNDAKMFVEQSDEWSDEHNNIRKRVGELGRNFRKICPKKYDCDLNNHKLSKK